MTLTSWSAFSRDPLWSPIKSGFDSPEAAGRECRFFHRFCRFFHQKMKLGLRFRDVKTADQPGNEPDFPGRYP